MSLVAVLKVSLTFVEKEIFREIGFQVEPGLRIGLVGPNGSGKTTLLRLLNQELSPDSGEIRFAKGIKIGYLPQDVQETLSGPLLPSVIASIPGRTNLKNDLEKTERALKIKTKKEEQAKLGKRLAEIHQDISRLDQEFPYHEAERILSGLGFKSADLSVHVSFLSRGWKMRAALASLLYQKPDLLLLDEPTNHLDIPSVRWLEQFLQDFKGAMILVSHDRDFLNRQINRVLSFEQEGLRAYSGNYDFYLKARKEERKALEAKSRNQEQKAKNAQKFIERFRAKASKARQAQSKIKLVKKMVLAETYHKEKTVRFSFPEALRSGREVVSIREMSKSFSKNSLYEGVNLTVLRGQKIAIIGPNGCGKTTLLRLIAGEIEPDEGRISLGYGVDISYFAQHHSDMLDARKTVIQEVYQVVPHESIGFVRGVLGAFLFSGSDVDKVIGVLSGGEKARVSLAKLLVKPGNFMVLDEPTNHLDISSSEALIDALEKYDGTLLFVSHNQSFINRLATKIWDIREGKFLEYPGNLDEYYEHLAGLEISGGNMEAESKKTHGRKNLQAQDGTHTLPDNNKRNRKAQKRKRAEKRRVIQDTLKPILTALELLEKRISYLESRQKELENILKDPVVFKDKDKGVPMLKEYNDVREEIEALLLKWEKRQVQLESTRKNLEL